MNNIWPKSRLKDRKKIDWFVLQFSSKSIIQQLCGKLYEKQEKRKKLKYEEAFSKIIYSVNMSVIDPSVAEIHFKSFSANCKTDTRFVKPYKFQVLTDLILRI